MNNKRTVNFKTYLPNIRAFVFDVDGVLSKTCISLSPEGEPVRTVNTKDGYAMQLAVKLGYKVGIITGGNTVNVRTRYNALGLTDVYLAAKHKTVEWEDFLSKYDLKAEEVMYMGDDIPDFEVMKLCGLAVCPMDAVPEIKAISHYVSDKCGGEGCGRDVIEQVLKSQGKWMSNQEAFGW